MKRLLVRTLATLSLIAVLSPLSLLAQDHLKATIPFNFNAAGKYFAAGDYKVSKIGEHFLIIRNVRTGANVMTMALPGEESKQRGTYSLIFNRYGESYFLEAIHGANEGFRLFPTRGEKELIASLNASKPVAVSAALRSK